MGTYLATGIVQKLKIQKKEVENNKLRRKDIIFSLQQELNLEHYIPGEDEISIFWTIKPEMLEGNFAEFLEAQFRMYKDISDLSVQQTITKVKEAKTGEERIRLAQSESLSHWQKVAPIWDSLRVINVNGFSNSVTLSYELMAFFIDGKIIMECYKDIFHYFERNIRLQEKQYPVAACLKIMITS